MTFSHRASYSRVYNINPTRAPIIIVMTFLPPVSQSNLTPGQECTLQRRMGSTACPPPKYRMNNYVCRVFKNTIPILK